MSIKYLPSACVFLTLILLAPDISRADDVWQHVPGDALAFIVVKNVSATDTKFTQLFRSLQVEFASPLGFLKATTGVSEGLDTNGDFLFAVLPGQTSDHSPILAVWLPTNDYDRLIRAMGAAPGQQISVVTVGGEDVLIARQADWAIVMDTDARERMEQTLAVTPVAPKQIADWKSWIDSNDATAIALTPGVRTILTVSGRGNVSQQNSNGEAPDDDIFGNIQPEHNDPLVTSQAAAVSSDDLFRRARKEIRKWVGSSRKLYNLAYQSNAVACGLRLDGDGSARIGLRIVFDENVNIAPNDSARSTEGNPSPKLRNGNDFILTGTGRFPATVSTAVAAAHVKQQIADLESTERMQYDNEATARVLQAVELAAADALSCSVLATPGAKQDGVYTNNFAAVRVSSASAFVDHAKEILRLWNKMNVEVKGDTHFVFDIEEIKLGDHPATQYSLDLANVEGGAAIPEIRQAMEKFFGPGGKLRLFIAPVDDTTVLLAMATPDQAAAVLKILVQKPAPNEDNESIRQATQLLPADRQWELFFNPHQYSRWLQRLREAMVGVPVIGGPLVKEFPPSPPPIAVAGGFREREAWAEIAVPNETVKSAGAYLQGFQKKGIQLQR